MSKVPSAFYKTKVWLPIKSDDTKKISWLKIFSFLLKQQYNVFASNNTTSVFFYDSKIHDFQMKAKWDFYFSHSNKFHKLQENGKDRERKIWAFVYAY